jgi:hypothetical protein
MILKKFPLLLFAAALLGCKATLQPSQAGTAPVAASGNGADPPAIYFEMGRAGGRVFTPVPEDSLVRIYAFPAGRAARLGHNHVLSAPEFTGLFYLPSSGPGDGRLDLTFRLDQLEIDNPAYRSALGASFCSTLLPDGQVRQMWISLGVVGSPDRLSLSSSPVLHQTDWGVQPFSLLSGLLPVQDDVVLDFKLTGACRFDMSTNC